MLRQLVLGEATVIVLPFGKSCLRQLLLLLLMGLYRGSNDIIKQTLTIRDYEDWDYRSV